MTQSQYNIVKIFLKLGNSAKRIAREFNAEWMEVIACESSHNYGEYLEITNRSPA